VGLHLEFGAVVLSLPETITNPWGATFRRDDERGASGLADPTPSSIAC